MASDRQRNAFEMFGETLVFNTAHATEYVAITAAAAEFAVVQAAYDALQDFMATQTLGDASMAVEQKSILKATIRRRMKEYTKTARALSYSHPGLHQAFHMPAGEAENDLVSTGRNMVTEATTYHVEFASFGIAPARTTELSGLLDQLDTAIAAKSEAEGETVGATAGVDTKVDEGMQAEIILDAIMSNFYRNDPVTLAEWKSARHVKRAAQEPDDGGTPPPPPPTPPDNA